jgi:segregation and condensation protein B
VTPGRQPDSPLTLAPDPDLHARLEAVLLVVDEPASVTVLAQAVQRPVAETAASLTRLAADYDAGRRGF